MKINVGSQNKTKVQSVKDTLLLYPDLFPNPEVTGLEVNVDLFGHPKNLQETTKGAVQRAKESFTDCDYSFGIEGGLIDVPDSVTGHMEIGVCAIYDGTTIFLGLSPAFEWPKKVLDFILEGKGDASKAFKELGLTDHEKLGAQEGGIAGFLTKGRMTREEQTKFSIITALIQLEQANLY